MTPKNALTLTLSGRDVAILCACLRQCEGWSTPDEMRRFLNTAASEVRDGFSEAEIDAVHEHIAGAWAERYDYAGRPIAAVSR